MKFYDIKGDVAFLDVVVDYEAQTITARAGEKPTTSPRRAKVA